MKSLVIFAIWLALSGAIYSRIAPFFALNRIFFSANENGTVKQKQPIRFQGSFKVPLWQKNHFLFFLGFWKCVWLTLDWQNFDLWFLLIQKLFTLRVSFGFHDPPCIRLERGKFGLTNQDSAGGKNSRVPDVLKVDKSRKALKSGNFSHWRWR